MENVHDILLNITSSLKLEDWRHNVHNFETIGQNFFGIIVPVVLSGVKDEKEVDIQLVLKLAPTDDRYRISGAVTNMFAREIFMYTNVFSKYSEIQSTFPKHFQYTIPYCYYVSKDISSEAIALEDLCASDYKPYTQMFLNLDHITISLEALAKLHALSFILKHTDSITYEEFAKVCQPLTERTYKRYMDVMVDRLSKALEKFLNTEYVPLLAYLKENCSKLYDYAIKNVKKTCISHGDIWKENILFKYEGDTPLTACLIDYQTSRVSSPAFDTLYLIISSTDTYLRKKYYHKLLQVYYQTLEQTLEVAGLKAQNVYSRDELDFDLNIVWPACLVTANTALWLSNGLQQEGHVRSKQIFKTQDEKEAAINKYKFTVKSIIDDLSSYGYTLPDNLS